MVSNPQGVGLKIKIYLRVNADSIRSIDSYQKLIKVNRLWINFHPLWIPRSF